MLLVTVGPHQPNWLPILQPALLNKNDDDDDRYYREMETIEIRPHF